MLVVGRQDPILVYAITWRMPPVSRNLHMLLIQWSNCGLGGRNQKKKLSHLEIYVHLITINIHVNNNYYEYY